MCLENSFTRLPPSPLLTLPLGLLPEPRSPQNLTRRPRSPPSRSTTVPTSSSPPAPSPTSSPACPTTQNGRSGPPKPSASRRSTTSCPTRIVDLAISPGHRVCAPALAHKNGKTGAGSDWRLCRVRLETTCVERYEM